MAPCRVFLGTLCLALLSACGDTGANGRRPNVLLITLDTVRADRLGAYGYDARDATPNLDAFARECVVFEQAFANSSFTPPSHASLLTSLYPSEHGLMHWSQKLADVPTAGELFTAAGYRTFAVSPLKTLFILGLERGFQETLDIPHENIPGGVRLGDAPAINARALPRLTADDERPFFAWLHYYDAHRVFARQGEQWARRYSDFDDLSVGDTEAWYQVPPRRRPGRPMVQSQISSEQATFIKDRYDGGLAYLDEQIGALLDELRASGVLEHTIVVITADHGEVLDEYEEEWFSHDPHLVDANIHVPLLVRLPGAERAGERRDALVQGVDLLPTLLELAGIDVSGDATGDAAVRAALDAREFSGLSLVPVLGGRTLPRDFVFADRMGRDRSGEDPQPAEADVQRERDRKRMLRTKTHKLVHNMDRGQFQLFAVGDEHTDVAQEQEQNFDRLVNAYRDHVLHLKATDGTPSELDDATRELLRQIGYLDEDGN